MIIPTCQFSRIRHQLTHTHTRMSTNYSMTMTRGCVLHSPAYAYCSFFFNYRSSISRPAPFRRLHLSGHKILQNTAGPGVYHNELGRVFPYAWSSTSNSFVTSPSLDTVRSKYFSCFRFGSIRGKFSEGSWCWLLV
jgi:hypothetical protein